MKVDRTCQWCKKVFLARQADVKRGWAKFCSKRCKAMEQENRTGQFSELLLRKQIEEDAYNDISGHLCQNY